MVHSGSRQTDPRLEINSAHSPSSLLQKFQKFPRLALTVASHPTCVPLSEKKGALVRQRDGERNGVGAIKRYSREGHVTETKRPRENPGENQHEKKS